MQRWHLTQNRATPISVIQTERSKGERSGIFNINQNPSQGNRILFFSQTSH